jgi:MFS transporter, MHS family, proline/betaine transporter
VASGNISAREAPPRRDEASRRRLLIAGVAGNILEWYDFSIYGFFALAIGQHFFPSRSQSTELIDAYGAFAAGFLMRPVGAILFGRIGDRQGRHRALMLSVLAMALPTFIIGLLPTYQQIGISASVLMVVMRLIQGLSVGGEYTTSVVFMVEHADESRRGVVGAFGSAGAFAGVLLGSAVGTVVALLLPQATLQAWGWRIPFLLGISIGIAGYFIRRELRDDDGSGHPEAPPFGEVLRTEWRRILHIAGVKVLDAVGFYLMFVYSTTYLSDIVGLTHRRALAINTLGMSVALLMLPVAGALSDRVGRKPVLAAAALMVIIFAWPLFNLLWHPVLHVPIFGQVGFAILIALFDGVSPAVAVEAFSPRVRCTAVAISHNLVMGLLGGTAPMVATYLIDKTDSEMAPPVFLMAAAVVSLVCVMFLTETARRPLDE